MTIKPAHISQPAELREPKARGPRQPREVELRKLVPNLLTAAALCSGIAAIYFATKYQPSGDSAPIMRAVALIGLAFVLDGLDGRLARLLRATSRFGERFDSISDFVCFGLAPAFILYRWALQDAQGIGTELGFAVVVVYALCAAIRLARFARQAGRKPAGAPVSKFFQGLPAPAAAFVVLTPLLVFLSPTISGALARRGLSMPMNVLEWVVLGHTALVAGLMVSTVPMISVKHVRVSRTILVPLMMGIALIAFFLVLDAWLTLAVLAMLYLLSLPLAVASSRRQTDPQGAAPASTPGIP